MSATNSNINVLGYGQGLTRLLGFSAAMANEKCDVSIHFTNYPSPILLTLS